MGNVINFQGNQITIQDLIDLTQKNIDLLESVVVIYKTKDGGTDISYSHQTIDDLVFAEKALSVYNTRELLTGEKED